MDESRKTYSLADIGRKLGRPRTTVAYWADNFQMYLPTVGSGRNKRYKHSALELFQIIERMNESNEPKELIEEELQNHATEITIPDEQDEKQPLYNEIIDSYKNMAAALAAQNELLIEQNEQREREFNEMKEMMLKREEDFTELKKMYTQQSDQYTDLRQVVISALEDYKTAQDEWRQQEDEVKKEEEQPQKTALGRFLGRFL
ncbi:hypothetical protein [Peribacillus frigoritolerans]|uniref:MerR family transcriptional regulator n=1 Tax=Peribacillus castrilensis TaxID=2897690 RepID=A0AAW9NJM5_9BACI|nr:hypothetical protein [Peribacillus castrilensis]